MFGRDGGGDGDRDHAEIEAVLRGFFDAFTSGPGSAARLASLRELFVTGAVIVRTCGVEPTVQTVDEFIAPRAALLSGGALTGFSEWPVSGRLDVFGDIAQWFGSYAKKGVQDGVPFEARGMKSVQFVRTAMGWRINAVAWDDERDGVRLS